MALPAAILTSGNFGVGGVDREHVGGTDGSALIAGMVDDEFVALVHLAQILDGLQDW